MLQNRVQNKGKNWEFSLLNWDHAKTGKKSRNREENTLICSAANGKMKKIE